MTEEAVRELAKKKTMTEMALELNVSEGKLRHFMRKHGIAKANPKGRSDQTLRDIYLRARRYGVRHAMKKFGLSKNQVTSILTREDARRRKSIEKFTPKRIAALRGAARKRAKRGRMGHVAEDFASFVIEYAVTGNSVNLDSLFVDYMRGEHGRAKAHKGRTAKKGLAKQRATLRTESLTHPDGEDSSGEERFAAEERQDPLAKWCILAKRLGIRGDRKRVIFFLTYYMECEQQETAAILGVSASRVSQQLKAIVADIAKKKKILEQGVTQS